MRLESLIVQCELYEADQSLLTCISLLVSFYFDTTTRKMTGMSSLRWRKTRNLISKMIRTLIKNHKTMRMSNDADIRLHFFDTQKDESMAPTEETQANVDWMNALKDESTESIRPKANASADKKLSSDLGGFSVINTARKKQLDKNFEWVYGNLLSFVKKLTVHLFDSLKTMNSKKEIYEQKMTKNVGLLLKTYKRASTYFGKLLDKALQCEVEVLAMSCIHNDYDETLDELKAQIDAKNVRKAKNASIEPSDVTSENK